MILHVDMDAFFAMLEVARRPELKGMPVIVGGLGQRGVVATASYEARIYGVNSAMPMVQARRKCPEGIFLPGDHKFYAEASRRIMGILYSYTPYLEPLSMDEAFLDISEIYKPAQTPYEISRSIRAEILEKEGLKCSIGISSKKHIAKIASQMAKPKIANGRIEAGKGIISVPAAQEARFLHSLDIRSIWGIGPATSAKLRNYGITSVGQIADFDLESFKKILGSKAAIRLKHLAEGKGNTEVQTLRKPKSMSVEETFAIDIHKKTELASHIVRLSDKLAARLRNSHFQAKCISLKIRYSKNFESITRNITLSLPVDTAFAIAGHAGDLLESEELKGGVRLIGLAVSRFLYSEKFPAEIQGSLEIFNEGQQGRNSQWSRVENAVDRIREKYSPDSIMMASSHNSSDNQIPGRTPWGPAA